MSKKDFILCCIGFICASVGLLLYMAYKMIFLLGLPERCGSIVAIDKHLILCLYTNALR